MQFLLVLVPSAGVGLLAAETLPGDLSGWLTGSAVSVLAFFTVAWLRGWVVSGREHDRVVKERDEALAELNRRAREDREMLLPVLAKQAGALAQSVKQRLDEGLT